MGGEAVSVDWDGYEIYDPGVFGPLNALPRAEARHAYNRRMAVKSTRIEMLRRLLHANGVVLGDDDTAIQDLNDWFRLNVQEDPDQKGRLLPIWYSVVNDVALFLGDLMIERHPGLKWEFFTWGKRNVSYQRHVIMGFTNVLNPKLSEDVDLLVAMYGHRIVAGNSVEDDFFWRMLKRVEGWA